MPKMYRQYRSAVLAFCLAVTKLRLFWFLFFRLSSRVVITVSHGIKAVQFIESCIGSYLSLINWRIFFMKSTWHVKILLNCKIRILASHLHIIKFSFLCCYKKCFLVSMKLPKGCLTYTLGFMVSVFKINYIILKLIEHFYKLHR